MVKRRSSDTQHGDWSFVINGKGDLAAALASARQVLAELEQAGHEVGTTAFATAHLNAPIPEIEL